MCSHRQQVERHGRPRGSLAWRIARAGPITRPARSRAGLMVEIERLRAALALDRAAQIAEAVWACRATVARTLRPARSWRASGLPQPVRVLGRRDEWARPGQLVHLDIKKLGRIGGDRASDHWRPAPSRDPGHRWGVGRRRHRRLLADGLRVKCWPTSGAVFVARFLRRSASPGTPVAALSCERIISDNGSAYRSAARRLLPAPGASSQRFTRPYTLAHQWQGRAVHRNAAARVGLRRRLRRPRSTARGPRTLVALLQLASAATAP